MRRLGGPGSGFDAGGYNGTAQDIKDSITVKVADYTALTSIANPTTGKVAIVTDKGIEGIFVYDATKSGTNNGGTILNGWVRQCDKTKNVKWFGAIGDSINNDYTAIKLAASSLQNGDALYFPHGIYHVIPLGGEDSIKIENIDDLLVLGDTATIYISDNSSNVYRSGFEFETCDNIRVTGFKFDLDNVGYSSWFVLGMSFNGCNGIEVDHNLFYNVGEGISLTDDDATSTINCKNVSIHNNKTENGGGNSIVPANYANYSVMKVLVGSGLFSDKINKLTITNNFCKDTGICYVQGVEELIINDNFSSNSIDSSIYVDNYIKHFTVNGNIVTNCGKDALKVIQTYGGSPTTPENLLGIGTVSGNTLIGAGLVSDSGGAHIILDGIRDVAVFGNSIKFTSENILSTNAQSGIIIQAFESASCTNNVIDGTFQVTDGIGGSSNGIVIKSKAGGSSIDSMSDSKNVIISNNIISKISGKGISINSDSYNSVDYILEGLLITNNIISLKDSGFIVGVYILSQGGAKINNLVLKDNHIYGQASSSIRVVPLGTSEISNINISYNYFYTPFSSADIDIRLDTHEPTALYSGFNIIENNISDGITTSFFNFGSNVKNFFRVKGNKKGSTIVDGYTSAPTTGTWTVGDEVFVTPVAGGFKGYVCTTAGTPGIWKGFGAISA